MDIKSNIIPRIYELFYLIVLLALIVPFYSMFSPFFVACFVFVFLFPNKKIQFFYFSLTTFLLLKITNNNFMALGWTEILNAVLIVSSSLIFYHLILYACFKWCKTHPMLCVLSFLAILLGLNNYLQSEIARSIAQILFLLFSKELWFLIVNLQQQPASLREYFINRPAAWFLIPMPPFTVSEMQAHSNQTNLFLYKSAVINLVLIYLAKTLKLLVDVYFFKIYTLRHNNFFIVRNYQEYFNLLSGATHNWPLGKLVAILMIGLSILLDISFGWGLMVSLARLNGFNLPSNNKNLLKARSFREFMTFNYHYYSLILMRVFFPRMKSFFSFFRGEIKIYISLFFSILIGGELFHIFRDLSFLRIPQATVFRHTIDFVPYFIFLALLSCLSVNLEMKYPRTNKVPYQSILMTGAYFCLFGVAAFLDVVLVYLGRPFSALIDFFMI